MWPWTLGPLPPLGLGAPFGYALHLGSTLCLTSFVMATMNTKADKQNNQAPDQARHLSFDSMLAEPATPALPVSQQLQVVLCVSETTQTLSVATTHRCPSAIMHALSDQTRMGQRKTEVVVGKLQ